MKRQVWFTLAIAGSIIVGAGLTYLDGVKSEKAKSEAKIRTCLKGLRPQTAPDFQMPLDNMPGAQSSARDQRPVDNMPGAQVSPHRQPPIDNMPGAR
jgi:hypothetical protein